MEMTEFILWREVGLYFVEGSQIFESKDILSATQSVVHGGAVSTSPGSLLKTQILESHPHLLNHNLHFNNLLHYLNGPEHLRAL